MLLQIVVSTLYRLTTISADGKVSERIAVSASSQRERESHESRATEGGGDCANKSSTADVQIRANQTKLFKSGPKPCKPTKSSFVHLAPLPSNSLWGLENNHCNQGSVVNKAFGDEQHRCIPIRKHKRQGFNKKETGNQSGSSSHPDQILAFVFGFYNFTVHQLLLRDCNMNQCHGSVTAQIWIRLILSSRDACLCSAKVTVTAIDKEVLNKDFFNIIIT